MRYFVVVGGRTYCVELEGDAVIVDGRKLRAELQAVPGSAIRHLLLDGRSHTLHVGETNGKGGWGLNVDGHTLEVEATDERTRTIRAMTARSATSRGPKPVRAPMPGMIVRIEVESGQNVRAGQGIVIIEAMKMENELRADGDGIVTRVLVSPGQAVEKGAVLVEFQDTTFVGAPDAGENR